MPTDQRSDAFQLFHREHAAAVFDLALRHSGDHTTAVACVDAVFAQLAGHWGAISDPLRFIRRAAVLFVCGTHRRGRRPARHCDPMRRRRGADASAGSQGALAF